VAVVGDSITYLSSPYIERTLKSDGYAIRAKESQIMAQVYPYLQSLVGTSPYGWIIELGTNDARSGIANWATAFNQEVSTLTSQRCVVLDTVNPRISPDIWTHQPGDSFHRRSTLQLPRLGLGQYRVAKAELGES
jgi:hypothetical protein